MAVAVSCRHATAHQSYMHGYYIHHIYIILPQVTSYIEPGLRPGGQDNTRYFKLCPQRGLEMRPYDNIALFPGPFKKEPGIHCSRMGLARLGNFRS